jgi:hypothetical protein
MLKTKRNKNVNISFREEFYQAKFTLFESHPIIKPEHFLKKA